VAVEPVCSSTKLRHCGVAEKLSNAVDPSNTASTATVPGRTGSDGRWSNGLPIAIRPSWLRRNADSRDATTLYTSNGSARAHQRSPQHNAPAIVTAR
jgi:hypothetical protein